MREALGLCRSEDAQDAGERCDPVRSGTPKFFKLLGEVMPEFGTGVVSARIHVRDGMTWAVSFQFDNAKEKAA